MGQGGGRDAAAALRFVDKGQQRIAAARLEKRLVVGRQLGPAIGRYLKPIKTQYYKQVEVKR